MDLLKSKMDKLKKAIFGGKYILTMGLSSSSLNRIIVNKLNIFNDNSDSSNNNELFLRNHQITDEMINEIIQEWFIKNKLFYRIKLLK